MSLKSWLDAATPRCQRCNRKIHDAIKCRLCGAVTCSENCFEKHLNSNHSSQEMKALQDKQRPRRSGPVAQRSRPFAGILGGCGLLVFGCLALLCGFGAFLGWRTTEAAKKELAEANRLWEIGQKADAVAKYKPLLTRNIGVPEAGEKPAVFQRVIDFEVERGDANEAKAYVEKAFEQKVAVSSSNKVAAQLIAQVREDREKKAAEERARADEKAGRPVVWKGRLGTGKLGTGATAYDELPDPWKGQFAEEWKAEVAASKNAFAAAEGSVEQAKAAARKEQGELAKFEARNKEELITKDAAFLSMHKDRKAAVAKAEAAVKDAEVMVLAAKEWLAALERNDPPYFKKPLTGCRTPGDIEDRLASLDAQKRGEEPKRPDPRFAEWGKCFDAAKATTWGGSLRPIPATVVDKGTLRFVPYKSFKAGDYEVNVYGDPDFPSGVEIGIRGVALDDPKAKANCFAFVASVLLTASDRNALGTLRSTEDVKKSEGLTFEVTPPTAEDAYGGWWVSVYDEAELDRSRASPPELAAITVAKKDVKDAKQPPPGANSWTANDLVDSRVVGGPTGGRVYVHSYTRKDGTFVQGHTRSAPYSGGGKRR
ncbi:MAG: hypothetical protein U0792_15415 [Gemmataceae bacterium]